MREVAIVGAGELGGLLAHVLARRSVASEIRLVDEADRVASGKALDIAQAAPIEAFATELRGTADLAAIGGARIVAIADRPGGVEWQGDDALMLLERIGRLARHAIVVCAGASHRELVDRGVRELHIGRARLLGSAPEALVGGARAIVALETDGSPRDVALSVLGVPPHHVVIPWEDATVGGFAVARLLDEPSRRRIERRVAALWPPGPYALAAAAAKVIESLLGHSRQMAACFVAPDDSSGVRARTAAMPVRLGPGGVAKVILPPLTTREQVALENAMML